MQIHKLFLLQSKNLIMTTQIKNWIDFITVREKGHVNLKWLANMLSAYMLNAKVVFRGELDKSAKIHLR